MKSNSRSVNAFLSPTARFWAWINDGWVKIALRANQTLSWGHSNRHDEGWSSEGHTWEHQGDTLTEEYTTDGTDCDGRLRTCADYHVQLDRLHVKRPGTWWDEYLNKEVEKLRDAGILTPDWEHGKSSQRDYSAEAMGY